MSFSDFQAQEPQQEYSQESESYSSYEEQDSSMGGAQFDESVETLREKRYLWTARGFAIVCAVSLITNILMLFSLGSLTPLVRVQPYQVSFQDKKNQIVSINPFRPSKDIVNDITQSLIRQYVIARHSVSANPDEMLFNWGTGGAVGALSSDDIYGSFAMENLQSDPGKPSKLEEYIKTRTKKRIIIRSVISQSVGEKGEYWNVDFTEETSSAQSPKPVAEEYVATLQIAFLPTTTSAENRMNNPLGFKVIRYGVQKKTDFNRREGVKI